MRGAVVRGGAARRAWIPVAAFLFGVAFPPVAPGRPAPRAVLVVDPGPGGPGGDAESLAVARRLAGDWDLLGTEDLPFLALADPGCVAASPQADAIAGHVDEGLRRYYEDTDLAAAAAAFGRALDALDETPCALAHRPADRGRMVTAGLLLVRMASRGGRTDEAIALARRLCARVGPDEVARADVPPDVRSFVDGIRMGLEVGAAALRVVVPSGTADPGQPPRLLVDGIPVDPSGVLRVLPGDHAISVALADGGVLTRRVRVPAAGLVHAIDLELSRALSPGAVGWMARSPEPALLERLAAQARVPVMTLDRRGDGSWRAVVTPAAAAGTRGEILRTMPHRTRADALTVVATGPAAARRPSAWPWVTGALSAGLLAGGVTLNVLANRDAQAVNAGTNRLDDQRSRRAGAIACYALAAASAAATVVLGVVRPAGRETLAVVPLEGGAAVGVGTTF